MRLRELCRIAVSVLALNAAAASGVTITILNSDSAGEGFNDPTPVAPLPGNAGVTRGQQRLNVFNAAAAVWARSLRTVQNSVQVRIQAQFNPLTCTTTGAVLGSAGPTTAHRDFAGAPLATTWYVQAVANSRAGVDLDAAAPDISAQFNSQLDVGSPSCLPGISWWYGIGSPPVAGTLDLFTTVLHEIGHGIGFLSLHNTSTGAKFLTFNDAYLRLLFDEETDEFWRDMTNGERLTSQVNTGQVVWRGAAATAKVPGFNAGINNARLRMFAPNPFQGGSSISHWDTALSPNELMEPILTSTARDYASYALMQDVGWAMLLIFKDSFESADDDFWSSAAL